MGMRGKRLGSWGGGRRGGRGPADGACAGAGGGGPCAPRRGLGGPPAGPPGGGGASGARKRPPVLPPNLRALCGGREGKRARCGEGAALAGKGDVDARGGRGEERYSAEKRNLKVPPLKRDNGCPCEKFTCRPAASKKHYKVIQWAEVNACP